MKSSERDRGVTVTVPPPVTVFMPTSEEERATAEFGAFHEWGSELDRAYDLLAGK